GSPAAQPLSALPPPAAKPPVASPPEDLGAKTRETAPAAADVPPALEDLVTRVMPAVVTIQTSVGRGSGFFVTPDTVITNVHVVGTDSTVTIRRSNGTTTMARVQATSPAYDIAVLKVFGIVSNQTVLELGTAAGVR